MTEMSNNIKPSGHSNSLYSELFNWRLNKIGFIMSLFQLFSLEMYSFYLDFA